MKQQQTTTNFTAGEWTPRLRGRVDLQGFNASAALLENCVVLRHGGATIRPSRDYIGEVKTSTLQTRIIPFAYSRDDAYLLEFGNQYMRVWRNGVQVESSPGVPYEISTPFTTGRLAAMDWAQGGDTLILVHPDVFPRRLQRFGDDSWVMSNVPFSPPALDEMGDRTDGLTMTISNVNIGTGRTITASDLYFLAADVGRVMSWGVGTATITAIVSGTQATADVDTTFATASADSPDWVLRGSPNTALTPSKDKPLGDAGTATLTTAGWRASDAGKWIGVNGGILKINTISSSTVANYVVVAELTGTTAASGGAWTLLSNAWLPPAGYPSTASFYQQRLWLGGTATYPQTVWGSKTGLFFNFLPGTLDDSAIYKTIDSDETNVIQQILSPGMLCALTYGGEFDLRGGIEKPITQTNCQITMRSRWGAEAVRPEHAGGEVLFIQRGGTALRSLARGDVDGFVTRDVSVFSEHLLRDGIKSIAWEQSPEQVMWVVTNAGRLHALTYNNIEQSVIAWASGNAEGIVEWVATIPDGEVDATYCLVRYVVNGVTKRYIERLNWSAPPGQDSRKEVTGAAATVWSGWAHLAGKTVSVLADGVDQGRLTVSLSGQITLTRTATTVSAGLPYAARIRLHPPEIGTGSGTSQGQQQSTHRVWVRLLESIGLKVNGQTVEFRTGVVTLDAPVPPFTGLKEIGEYGWSSGDTMLELAQEQPYPWTVLAVIRDVTANAR